MVVGRFGLDTLRSPFVDRLRLPRDWRVGPAEDEAAGLEFADWLLVGPKERKFRKERKGVEPVELELWVLADGRVGLPLTARCLPGDTRPRWGEERELGRELCGGRGAMTGICDWAVFWREWTDMVCPEDVRD